MACFVAPTTAAIVTTVIKNKVPAKYHVEWLFLMLWGGTAMLIFDHVANHEIVPYYPFFTRSWDQIWPEVLKIGLPMTIIVFAIWYLAVRISWLAEKKRVKISQI